MPPLAPALRAAFPHAGAMMTAPYCVGASIGFYVGAVDDPFPDETELACHLEKIRGSPLRAGLGKPRRGFVRRAQAIIDANDDGSTAHAWELLAAALRGLDADPERLSVVRRCAVRRERDHGIAEGLLDPSPAALDPPLRPPPFAPRPSPFAPIS